MPDNMVYTYRERKRTEELIKKIQALQSNPQYSGYMKPDFSALDRKEEKIPLTWQYPSTSEMSYHNRGAAVPDIGLGQPMGPVETATTIAGIAGLAKALTSKAIAKAPFLIPKKEINRGGMEILKFRTNPVIDIDKVNNARHIGGGGIHITQGQAERTVEELERVWKGPWELYETPGGYRAIYTGRKRARPVDFFDDNRVSAILDGVVDPDYIKYSKANGNYGVRISPKRAITERPLTRPLRSGEVIEDDFIARKIKTIGNPKEADRRSQMVLKYMHDRPIEKYNAGKKVAPPSNYTEPTEEVLEARERAFRSGAIGEPSKISAEIDNINARGGITAGERRVLENYTTPGRTTNDEELAIVTNILERRTGATRNAIDDTLIDGYDAQGRVNAIRERNERAFLEDRARITNYGEQTPIQKITKRESQFRYRQHNRSPIEESIHGTPEEGSYLDMNMTLNDGVRQRLNMNPSSMRVPKVRPTIGYEEVKKAIGKESVETSDVIHWATKNMDKDITMSIPGKKRVIMMNHDPIDKQSYFSIIDRGTKGESVSLHFSYDAKANRVGGFLLESNKASGHEKSMFKFLTEIPDIMPPAKEIDFGSLSADSAPLLLKHLKKEVMKNPKRWNIKGYGDWRGVNSMGLNSRIAKNYNFLLDQLRKKAVGRSSNAISELMNLSEYRNLQTDIEQVNKAVGKEVMRITTNGLEYRMPEVAKLLPAILTYLGIKANDSINK